MNTDHPARKTRVLIVEDEAIVACELQSRIEGFGYEVAGVAGSADQALTLVAQGGPDLVVMDIHIRGGVDGIELAEQLRRLGGPAVIFLTAHSNQEISRRAQRTEPFAYLLKPYQDNELRIAMELAIYRQRMERERAELTRQLEQALAEIKTLRGLIPICAWCGKLRDDHGFWLGVEAYLKAKTEVSCTHSICPDCYEKQLALAASRPEPT
jgi:CheY-like chemotaxis protein